MCGKGVGLGLFPSDSLKSQSLDFDEIAHIESLYGVQRLRKTQPAVQLNLSNQRLPTIPKDW